LDEITGEKDKITSADIDSYFVDNIKNNKNPDPNSKLIIVANNQKSFDSIRVILSAIIEKFFEGDTDTSDPILDKIETVNSTVDLITELESGEITVKDEDDNDKVVKLPFKISKQQILDLVNNLRPSFNNIYLNEDFITELNDTSCILLI
jgi:hypothetical protein